MDQSHIYGYRYKYRSIYINYKTPEENKGVDLYGLGLDNIFF